MRAWAVVENEAPLQQIELPTPEPTGTEVLLQTTYCGVCHSDIHIWEGRYDLGGGKVMNLKDRGLKLPLAMGHEIVGRVVKLGPQATGVKPGDIRIVYPWVGCGTCAACTSEEDNMCMVPKSVGVFQNGGYATHVLAPHPDEPIVLIGAGGLGLNAIAVLKALKHRNIVVVDISAEKRAAAERAGATTTVVGSGEAVHRRIIAACGAQPVAIIDLVNGTASARFAFDALRKGGKLVQVGLFGGELALPLPMMPIRALTIQGSYVGNPKELRELVRLAQQGDLQPLPVTTVPQSHANEALMRLRDGHVTGRLVLKAEAA